MADQVSNLSRFMAGAAGQFEIQALAKADAWSGPNRGEFQKILAAYDRRFTKAPDNRPFNNFQTKAIRNSNPSEKAVIERPETTAAAEKAEEPELREETGSSRGAGKVSSDETKNSATQPAHDEAREAQSAAKQGVAETSGDSEPATPKTAGDSDPAASATGAPPELAAAIPDESATTLDSVIPAVTDAGDPSVDDALDDPDSQPAIGMNPADTAQTALLMSLVNGVLPAASEIKAVSESAAAAAGVDGAATVQTLELVAAMTAETAGQTDPTAKSADKPAQAKTSAPGAQSTLASVLEELGIVSDRTGKNVATPGGEDGKPSRLFAATPAVQSGETGVSGGEMINSGANPDQGKPGIFDLSKVAKEHAPSGLAQPFIEDGGENKPLNLTVIQSQLAFGEGDKGATGIQFISAPLQKQPAESGMAREVAAKGTPVVNKNEVMAQIIDHAKVMVSNGHSEMEVNLKPDHLGKLQLKIAVENQTITAKFTAESQQVKQILESNMDDLRRHLQETGIQVDSLMVSVGNSSSGNEQFARGSFSQDFRNGSGTFGYTQPAKQDEVESSREETRRPVRDTVIDLIA